MYQQDDGSYVDSSGRAVNLLELGVHVQNTASQEDLFDVSVADSLSALPSSHLPSIPESPDARGDNARNTQGTVISIPSADSASLLNTSVMSVRSNGECRLVTPEAKSDLFEDHLLPNLDSGANNLSLFCFEINKKHFYFRDITMYSWSKQSRICM